MIIVTQQKYLYQKTKGAVLVELALVLPIFFILIFSMVELGWIIHTRLTMSQAAREGARVLAMNATSLREAESLSSQYLADMGYNPSSFSISAHDTDPNCISSRPIVSMHISTLISDISLIGDPFNVLTNLRNLNVEVTLRKECIRNL